MIASRGIDVIEGMQDEVIDRRRDYERLFDRGLNVDLTRGKPAPEQLSLSAALLSALADDYFASDGTDCRNYGGNPAGLTETRQIFASLLDRPVENVVVSGSSSLALMYGVLSAFLLHGSPIGHAPWLGAGPVRMLCPVPGYDRHFRLCESLGIEMIPVPLTGNGPDMEIVERHVAADPSIRAMWCMPRYSNPTGEVYSKEVVHRLAQMETASSDFHLLWDDAYVVHSLHGDPAEIVDIIGASERVGRPGRPIVFTSTSKMTFAGSGLAVLAGSAPIVSWWLAMEAARTIGPDKINQLRHARFLVDKSTVLSHMQKHQEILRPKFAVVDAVFSAKFADHDDITWSRPQGGYFIDLRVGNGTASRVIELAFGAGVKLTKAGSAFPYGRDEHDRHVRIAPSFPSIDELSAAAEGVAVCALLARAEMQAQAR